MKLRRNSPKTDKISKVWQHSSKGEKNASEYNRLKILLNKQDEEFFNLIFIERKLLYACSLEGKL